MGQKELLVGYLTITKIFFRYYLGINGKVFSGY